MWQGANGRGGALPWLFALAVAAGPPAPAGDAPVSLRDWYRGPVRYLMTRTETRLFKRLQTDAERLQFIRRFWERRDPDPRTPQNEARIAFWQRVVEANRRFGDTPLPGWKTDRGKIFILLGPPDQIERRDDFDTGIKTIPERGLMRWHYRGLRRSMSPETIIAFVKDVGDWRLTDDPKLSSIYLDMNAERPVGLPPTLANLVDSIPWEHGTLGTALDLARLQEVPTERELLRAVVRTEEYLGTLDVAARWHLVASAPHPLLALTLAVRRDALDPPWDGSALSLAQRFAATAELRPADPAAERHGVIEFPEESFVAEPAPQPGDPYLRVQALRPVPPGRWRLSAVLADRRAGDAGAATAEIAVPGAAEGAPLVTGPVLARAILPAGPERPGTDLPFRFHDHLVIPRLGTEVPADEPFGLFLEVLPPPGRDGPVALEWQIFRWDGDTPEPLAPPSRVEDGRGPRAWRFEPGQIPAGRYRAMFTAMVPGAPPVSRTIDFTVTARR
ncbi:MAG: GWxTD domain-containing protein [Acidobacteria bacterium]|nr:MAG: GWxTD domain-containing protein [Acidobacteriota bacterium]